jgi:drug/metabolite transporter (DMT)-like permease
MSAQGFGIVLILLSAACFAGLARVGASRAALYSTFEPVVTVLAAASLLGSA